METLNSSQKPTGVSVPAGEDGNSQLKSVAGSTELFNPQEGEPVTYRPRLVLEGSLP